MGGLGFVGPVKADTVSPPLRCIHAIRSSVAQAQSRGVGPRHSLDTSSQFSQQSDYYVIMHLMRCQTQRDYRTRMLIEDTNHVKKSRIELGKEPRVGHPCCRTIPKYACRTAIGIRAFCYTLLIGNFSKACLKI